jgi:MFS family permease
VKLTATINRAAYPITVLRQRNFGLVWTSMSLAAVGTQMEAVVLGWFVLTLTDSPFLVGLIAAARMALNFLALVAGAVADRVRRQRLLAAVEFIMTALGLLILALVLSGFLQVWHLFAVTLVGGLVRMFQMPAAQALVADTLTKEHVSNGAALSNVGRNLATIVGPLLGGVLFQAAGPQGAYGAIVVLYSLSGLCALFIEAKRFTPAGPAESVFSTVSQGLKYVKGQQVLWATLLVAVIINLTGWPFHTSLMPIFARDELGTGSAGLGMLLTAFGIGALAGSIGLSVVRDLKHTGKALIVAVVVWHASMVLFTLSDSFPLALATLVVTGAGFGTTQVVMLTVLLRTAQPEFRGRVMGLRALAIYAYTFGSVNSGAMAGAWGAPWAANVNAVVGMGLVALLALLTPKLWRS